MKKNSLFNRAWDAVCSGADCAKRNLQKTADLCSLPGLIEKERQFNEALRDGYVIDKKTREVIDNINPKSPEGRETIKRSNERLSMYESRLKDVSKTGVSVAHDFDAPDEP